MSEETLAEKLRQMYDGAPRNEATCHVILFGIRYAGELKRCGAPLKRILALSGVSMGYLSEIGKGIRLAAYVKEKEGEKHG